MSLRSARWSWLEKAIDHGENAHFPHTRRQHRTAVVASESSEISESESRESPAETGRRRGTCPERPKKKREERREARAFSRLRPASRFSLLGSLALALLLLVPRASSNTSTEHRIIEIARRVSEMRNRRAGFGPASASGQRLLCALAWLPGAGRSEKAGKPTRQCQTRKAPSMELSFLCPSPYLAWRCSMACGGGVQ